MVKRWKVFFFPFVFLVAVASADITLPDKGFIKKSDLHLGRAVIPSKYFESSGRKSAFLGLENGISEVWIYPYKVLQNLRLTFLVGDEEEVVNGEEAASLVDVYPHQTIIRYVRSSFRVEAVYFTPLDLSGAVLLLDVESFKPLSVIVSFKPVLRPMWPAGLGGQYCYWNGEKKYYVISEGSRKNAALIGSPKGMRFSSGPAHALPEGEVLMRIDVKREQAEKFFYPIVITASHEGLDQAEEIYRHIEKNLEDLYREKYDHYTSLLDFFLYVQTPDKQLDEAFQWAKVAVDKAFVCNPQLGCGLVAGYGLSRNSERPGFNWFFGGDTFYNAWAVNSYGDFSVTGKALKFIRKNQRSDGKIMHELSQGAAFINWFEDYPYGYYHAETSPYYIVAIRDYVHQSGDKDFLVESWSSLKKAYDYVLSADTDGDGLMENSVAGLAALELGSFLDKTKTDIYLAALSVESHSAFNELCRMMEREDLAHEANRTYLKSINGLNQKFWSEKENMLAHALAVSDKLLIERTIWPFMPLFFRQLGGIKASTMLDFFASSEMSTDWGVRSLSPQSSHYDPLNYNYGSVWPFLTGYTCLAEYRYGRRESAYAHLEAMVQNTTNDALGYCPELLSGEYFVPIETSVPHQVFSSSPIITCTVRGLFGLEGNALEKEFFFEPRCPGNWPYYEIKNYRVGEDVFFISVEKKRERSLYTFSHTGEKTFRCHFAPTLGWGTRVVDFRVNGKPCEYRKTEEEGLTVCRSTFEVGQKTKVEIVTQGGVDVFLPPVGLKPGDSSMQMKIVHAAYENKKLVLNVEGRGGMEYKLKILSDWILSELKGATRGEDTKGGRSINIYIEGSPLRYQSKRIEIRFSNNKESTSGESE
ncbi:MAG: hypothetical protein JXB26_15340 [Candidatus Aminicenantes bacterium]|nr:hypothetical protein [Candidatus Aminicenantes bacterium]